MPEGPGQGDQQAWKGVFPRASCGSRDTVILPGTHRQGREMRGFIILLLIASGCALHVPPTLQAPPHSFVVSTGGVNRSAIFLHRVEGGIVLIELGWWGAEEALAEGLKQLGARTDDVIAVFLTHSHRDHIGAWRSVRHAPFYLATAEEELLFGREAHGGWLPSLAEKIRGSDRPAPEEVQVHAFSSDTVFAFGRDTLRAFLVPGHTEGSTAYLFRGTLFAGDAIAKTWISGFRPALGRFSVDASQARRSLESLRERIAPFEVSLVCTSHLECSAATDEFWADVLGN
ncbi:MAG: MBL fold metallo-hydrolase [Gemmatimonadales bacterium]|nr:MAG: MBL fold metallo-hydrolase [Gemmatimonadales bacterium]